MRIGVVYPQTELPADPATVKAYAMAVEKMGYEHILVYDHVLGADPEVHRGWQGPYDIDTTFHEPFVLFGYLAGIVSMELVTGIIISPQRQTALIAKQAAEVDILSAGRLRLGLGIGWNKVEYDALGQDFSSRGRRQEEQIGLLKRLWTERTVSHEGRFDHIEGAGLAPLPVQRPIPIWLGGKSAAAYQRAGRWAEGWFPQVAPGPDLEEARRIIGDEAEASGRDPASVGMEGRVTHGAGGVADLVRHVEKWIGAGATHLGVNTMGSGLADLDAHLTILEELRQRLGIGAGR